MDPELVCKSELPKTEYQSNPRRKRNLSVEIPNNSFPSENLANSNPTWIPMPYNQSEASSTPNTPDPGQSFEMMNANMQNLSLQQWNQSWATPMTPMTSYSAPLTPVTAQNYMVSAVPPVQQNAQFMMPAMPISNDSGPGHGYDANGMFNSNSFEWLPQHMYSTSCSELSMRASQGSICSVDSFNYMPMPHIYETNQLYHQQNFAHVTSPQPPISYNQNQNQDQRFSRQNNKNVKKYKKVQQVKKRRPAPVLSQKKHTHYRTRLCRHFLRGHCIHGDRCNFLHRSSLGHPDDQIIFLGGLPAELTPQGLLNEMKSEYGMVIINIPAINGGFTDRVVMENLTDAETLIQLGKIVLSGKQVDVRPYHDKLRSQEQKSMVFIGGLPKSISTHSLIAELGRHGITVINRPHLGDGYARDVQLESPQIANNLVRMKTLQLFDRSVDIRPFVNVFKQNRYFSRQTQKEESKLFKNMLDDRRVKIVSNQKKSIGEKKIDVDVGVNQLETFANVLSE